MSEKKTQIPDSTAVRVALWRALHVQIDAEPHVLNDERALPRDILLEGLIT